ncbi:uncharacterized protein [Panulirus ornatus]|uniref:uncharacterized protein n=1 Tax=Panulirus ornatus TaxID=150431 RepID=UPI003A8A9EDA
MGFTDIVDSSLTIEHLSSRDDRLIARSRVRRSAMASSSLTVQYRSSVHRMFRFAMEDTADYLVVSGNGTVTVGPQSENSCFVVHQFDPLQDTVGTVMVLETRTGDFVTGGSSEVSLMENSSSLESVSETDERFFLLETHDATTYKIKHLHTGKYLLGSDGHVSLVSGANGFTEDMLFHMFNCSGTSS